MARIDLKPRFSPFKRIFIIARDKYEYTLSNLIKLTFDLVQDKFATEASVVTAIAQRVNPGVNIEGCIA
jgi:hypothetical protein